MGEKDFIKGILKTQSPNTEPLLSSPKQYSKEFRNDNNHDKNSLKWDETSLAETEANKSSTMKITEPKTPFVHNFPDISDDEHPTSIPKLQLNSDSEGSSVHFSSSAEWESSEELGQDIPAEEKARRKAKFKSMRREHYKMGESLHRGRELVQSETEQSDGDD